MSTPEDIDDVQETILLANERGTTLDIVGGGSKTGVGRPETADAPLDMSRFCSVIDYDPAELVLTAGAGTPLAQIEALLAANGQMLGFEPMDHGPIFGAAPGRATLGGVLAANAAGPRRLSAGAARDHFLGLKGVTGRGDVFRAGGQVVKNVTGYDLPKLLAGSWGTLAALTEVTLKVLPRPRTSATVLVSGLDDRQACAAMSQAVGSPAPVTGAAHLPANVADGLGFARPVTALRLEGVAPSVSAGVEALRGLLKDQGAIEVLDPAETAALWLRLRDAAPFAAQAWPLWRISTPPMEGWRVLQALAPLGAEGYYDWAGGLIWLTLPDRLDADAPAVRAALAAPGGGGHATLVRAPSPTRSLVPIFQPQPPGLAALSARVKASFDPKAVLTPGRRLHGEPARTEND